MHHMYIHMYAAYVYASSHICTCTCAYHICGVVTWYTPYMQHMYTYVCIICIRVVAHIHAHVYISRIAPSSRSTHHVVHIMRVSYVYMHASSRTCTYHVCVVARYARTTHAHKMYITSVPHAHNIYVTYAYHIHNMHVRRT
jgi:hypothetical protein